MGSVTPNWAKPPAQPAGSLRDLMPSGWHTQPVGSPVPLPQEQPLPSVEIPQASAYPMPWRDAQGQGMTPQGWGMGTTYYMGNAPWIPQAARTGLGPGPMTNLGSLLQSSYRPSITMRR